MKKKLIAAILTGAMLVAGMSTGVLFMAFLKPLSNTMIIWKYNHGLQPIMTLWMTQQ